MIEHSENYFENWLILKEKEQLASRIREYVIHNAKIVNLKVSFAPVRRKSDILLAKLRGKYKYAHNLSICLKENFPEVDIETPESLQKNDYFALIVTKKLADQEVVANERRAKLVGMKKASTYPMRQNTNSKINPFQGGDFQTSLFE